MLYERAGYDPRISPDSYWRATTPALAAWPQLDGDIHCDIAIIGAGYAGLNAALELVESHGADVVVCDAAQPGWGASGRNGGFCCLGGTILSAQQIARRYGAQASTEWTAFERAAIARVQRNLDRYAIDATPSEQGELCLTDNARRWQRLHGAGGLARAQLSAQGLHTAVYHGGSIAPEGFGLHPLRYVHGLARAAQTAGLRLYGDSAITKLTQHGKDWVLQSATGQIRARQVLMASNGYSREDLVPWLRGRILPVISNIMVTDPIAPALLQAQGWTRGLMAYDDRRLLHYFRLLPDNRMLFGARGGLSFKPASVAAFEREARAAFDMIFPQFAAVRSAYRWNGLVCLTGSFAPYIGPVPGARGLWLALGWHGNGVAAASEGGRRAAQAIMGAPDAPPALARHAPQRFWFPRKWALASAMALARHSDGAMRALA